MAKLKMTRAQAQAELDRIFPPEPVKATAVPAFLSGDPSVPLTVEPIAVKATVQGPKPIIVERIVVRPNAERGQSFEPYAALSVRNQANGKFHTDHRLSQRYLDAIRAYTSKHGWTL